MTIKMLTKLRRRMEGHSENINKKLENIRKNQSKLRNIITVLKNMLEVFIRRPDELAERIRDLEGWPVELIQTE